MTELVKEEVKVKRPNKAETVIFLGTLGGFVLNKVPGFSKETFKAQAQQGGFKLYEEELEDVAETVKKKNPSLVSQDFIDLLHYAGVVLEGKRPAFGGVSGAGGAQIKINSRERAEEVVTSKEPNAVEQFMEIMSGIVDLKKDADKLIEGRAEISVAIKNLGEFIKKREVTEVTEEAKS